MIKGLININSLRNKYNPIRPTLQNELCDIFTLSETNLGESFATAKFHITNFVLHPKYHNAHGGGVITYIKSDLPHRRRYDMESNASGFGLIILEVQLCKKEKWLICSYYKLPDIRDNMFDRSSSELTNSLQIATFFDHGGYQLWHEQRKYFIKFMEYIWSDKPCKWTNV